MRIFSVIDQKAEAYLQPFFAPNAAVAIRVCTAACEDEGHTFRRHSEDFVLFEVGGFDEQTGELQPESPPRVICRILDLIPKTPPQLTIPQGGE